MNEINSGDNDFAVTNAEKRALEQRIERLEAALDFTKIKLWEWSPADYSCDRVMDRIEKILKGVSK